MGGRGNAGSRGLNPEEEYRNYFRKFKELEDPTAEQINKLNELRHKFYESVESQGSSNIDNLLGGIKSAQKRGAFKKQRRFR